MFLRDISYIEFAGFVDLPVTVNFTFKTLASVTDVHVTKESSIGSILPVLVTVLLFTEPS